MFVIEALNLIIDMNYVREGQANWCQTKMRATALLIDNIVKDGMK